MKPSKWTEWRVETAQRLWRDGVSASIVAARIGGGLTRSAVIGKMTRTLGPKSPESARAAMQHSGKMKARRDKAAKPKPKASQFKAAPATKAQRDQARREWDAFQAILAAKPDVARVDSIVDLEDHQCRWPIGEKPFKFCGDTRAPGSSYCACHTARAQVRAGPNRLPPAHHTTAIEPATAIDELHETVAA